MGVSDTLEELLEVEARMAAMEVRKTQLRKELQDRAEKSFREDGAKPTWRCNGLGTALLAGGDTFSPAIVDPAAYLAWCKENHPSNVVMIESVEPALLKAIESEGMIERVEDDVDEARLVDSDGVIVPGVICRRSKLSLRVSLDKEAKQRAIREYIPTDDIEATHDAMDAIGVPEEYEDVAL